MTTTRWWHRWLRTPGELRELGVVGLNMRNARYLLPNNPRRLFELVDNKLTTKRLATEHGLAVPETYAVVRSPHDTMRFEQRLAGHESFVVKPARGSGGRGVLVVAGRDEERYLKPSGVVLGGGELRHHVSNVLAGLFSLGGGRDEALVEYRVLPTPVLTELSYQGAPDIRVVLLHGYPAMAMLRAATRESDGRANLHQGALGIGIDLATGRTVRAVHHGRPITRHPDLKQELLGRQLPGWERILGMAVTCQEMTGLGYLGVDLMIDRNRGPMMLEVNARPGLAIQMANGEGLLRRLEAIVEHHRRHPHEAPAGRIAFSMKRFAARGTAPAG